MKFGKFYEIPVPRPAPPEAEHERLREIIEQVVLAEEMGSCGYSASTLSPTSRKKSGGPK